MDVLTELFDKLDSGAPRRDRLESYYAGLQPLAFLVPEARAAIGDRFGRMASNIPRLAVTALAERLRITGFAQAGQPAGQLWQDWLGNDLDQQAPVAHREALALGESFVVVWADEAGAPLVTIESAHQTAVLRDPATRTVTAAVKRWTTGPRDTPTGTSAVLYLPDKITHLHSNAVGATGGFTVVSELPNPLGQVPVVPLQNSDRLLGRPSSELDDLIPLVDGLNKTLVDMLVSSEYAGRPRRWATGVELVEDENGEVTNPYGEGVRMMINEDAEGKFGQLDAADLSGYESAVKVFTSQIMAVSALPEHYIGVLSSQPSSADALRAAEASLTARAEARQATFGRAWEQVARLMVAVRTGADPATVDVHVNWADPATRSVAQEADAVVKLYTAGLLPSTYALAKLGYSDDEITAIRAARRTEALDTAGTDLSKLVAS
ncbi:MAG: phage portal protein [Propionibacteriaceae bacterium]|nr:phage portal protein [Propionibacteriaceae bacterium]